MKPLALLLAVPALFAMVGLIVWWFDIAVCCGGGFFR